MHLTYPHFTPHPRSTLLDQEEKYLKAAAREVRRLCHLTFAFVRQVRVRSKRRGEGGGRRSAPAVSVRLLAWLLLLTTTTTTP